MILLDVISVGNILHLIGQVHDYSCFSGPVIVQKCWRVYITPLPTSHNRGQPSTKYSQGLVTTVPVPSPLRQSYSEVCVFRSSQGGLVVKESTCQYRRFGFDPWVGKTPWTPGEGNGNSLQLSCLGNPMDRGAWWVTVHGVTKSRIQLSD